MKHRGPRKKICEHCGERFGRKRWSSGTLEKRSKFDERKFCSLDCANLGKRKDWELNPPIDRSKNPLRWDAPIPIIRRNYTVGRGDYWRIDGRSSFCDDPWRPQGKTGKALTNELVRLCDEQADWVLSQPDLVRRLRESPDPEVILAGTFSNRRGRRELLFGTVRRVKHRLRMRRVG